MCGIAGIYARTIEQDNSNLLVQMLDTIRHRGPDDGGVYSTHPISIGHRRLSVLDLSDAGHQPMASRDGRYRIIYNGEIYNYIEIREELEQLGYEFHTKSDTEVILHAYRHWGKDCLGRFNGMWSFAIWDDGRKELFCARDRLGVKPFVYYADMDHFIFASEIKALLQHPAVKAAPNPQAIYDFIIYGRANHTHDTFFDHIFQLPAAHFAIVNEKGLHIERFWDISADNTYVGTFEEAAESFYQLFEDAVRIRFRSDVEVGSCLSGGLDSSSIVCVADRLIAGGKIAAKDKLRTFTFVSKHKEYDESHWAAIVLSHTNSIGTATSPSEDELVRSLEHLVYTQEEPFGSTSIFAQYMVMSLIRDSGIKVTLDGQGSDEMLVGYAGYADYFFADLYASGQYEELERQIRIYCDKYRLTPSIAFDRARQIAETGKLGRHIEANGRFLRSDFLKEYHNEIQLSRKFDSFLQNQLYQEMVSSSVPLLLRYEDRNSMAFSIESRLPFLDYRLVEFIFSLPVEMKVNNWITKYILRKALADVLPAEIRDRQDKMGFATPEQIWFRGALRSYLDDILYSESLRQRGIFQVDNVLQEWEAFKSGARNDSFIIWRIISVELWFRRFID